MYQSDILRLRGANVELRTALQQTQARERESTRALHHQQAALATAQRRAEELAEMNRALREARPAALPDGVAPSSMDVIASLSEQLVQTLHALHTREAEAETLGAGVQRAKRNAVVLAHRQALLYGEYARRRREWAAKQAELEQQLSDAQQAAADGAVWQREHAALTAALQDAAAGSVGAPSSASGSEAAQLRQHLAELGRRVATLAVSEEGARRRLSLLETAATEAHRQTATLRHELTEAEATYRQRIDYLERARGAAHTRLRDLRGELEQCVPQSEADRLASRNEVLATRYRLMLERYNTLQQENLGAREARLQLTERENQLALCQREVELLHARLQRATTTHGDGGHVGSSSATGKNDAPTTADPVATARALGERVEHEKQRAALLVVQRDQAQTLLQQLQARNAILEGRLDALSEESLQAKETEADLRARLAQHVPAEALAAKQAEIVALHVTVTRLEDEGGALRERADIAVAQAEAVQRLHQASRGETEVLRAQLLELHVTTDMRAALGRLHHRNLALQMAEAEALRRSETERRRNLVLQRDLRRLEAETQRRDDELARMAQESRARSQHLRGRLQALRTQYAGAAPLDERERLAALLEELRAGKREVAREVLLARQQREEAEDDLQRLREQHAHLQALLTALGKDGAAGAQAREWHARLGEVRLENMRLERELLRARERVRYLERVGAEAESAQRRLETESVALRREHEEREAAWEQRELSLEQALAASEARAGQQRTTGAVFAAGPIDDLLPNPNATVGVQLEEALHRLRQMHAAVGEAQVAVAAAEERALAAGVAQTEAEARGAHREAQLARVGAHAAASGLDGAAAIASAAGADEHYSADAEAQLALVNMQARYGRAVGVAQATISSLQRLLDSKDGMLTEARAELGEMQRQTASEREATTAREAALARQLSQVQGQAESAARRYEAALAAPPDNARGGAAVDRLMAQVAQLEDQVATQRQQLHTARQALAVAETQQVREAHTLRSSATERDSARLAAEARSANLTTELSVVRAENGALQDQVRAMQAQVRSYEAAAAAAREEAERASLRLSPQYLAKTESVERQRSRSLAQAQRIAELETLVLELNDTAGAGRDADGMTVLRNDATTTSGGAAGHNGGTDDDVDDTDAAGTLSPLRRSLQRRRTALTAQIEEHAAARAQLQAQLEKARAQCSALQQELSGVRAEATAAREATRAEEALRVKAERDAKRHRAEATRLRRALEEKEKEAAESAAAAAAHKQRGSSQPERGTAATAATAGRTVPLPVDAASEPPALQKWAADKKLQRRAEVLRTRLTEREEELKTAQRQLDGARATVSRLEREREQLNRRLAAAGSSHSTAPGTARRKADVPDGRERSAGERGEAASRIEALEAENRALRHRLEVDAAQDVAARDVELRELREALTQAGEGAVAGEQGLELSSAAREVVAAQGEVLELRFQLRELQARLAGREHDPISARAGGAGAGAGGSAVSGTMDRAAAANASEKLAALTQENRRLRRERQELREAVNRSGGVEGVRQAERAHAVLASEHERLKQQQRSEREAHTALQRRVTQLETALSEASETQVRLQKELRSAGQPEVGVTAMYETQLRQLREADTRKTEALRQAREALQAAAAEEARLRAVVEEAQAAAQTRQGGTGGNAVSDAELAEAELRLVAAEEENARLREELAAFDPQFFEEIEDLKYNYQVARTAAERYAAVYGPLEAE